MPSRASPTASQLQQHRRYDTDGQNAPRTTCFIKAVEKKYFKRQEKYEKKQGKDKEKAREDKKKAGKLKGNKQQLLGKDLRLCRQYIYDYRAVMAEGQVDGRMTG